MQALPILLALPFLAPAVQDDDALERRITPEVLVVRAAAPAVVYVETNVKSRQWSMWYGWVERESPSSGSGVVIHEDGYIVTNYHVVRGAQRTEVRFDPKYDERVYPAQVLSYVEEEDLALLKIDGDGLFPTVPMGTSSDLMVGERVLAIGNPYGQTFTVSAGIISGLHRDIQASGLSFRNLIQTDASINPGNSGGPLLNINGELIGINSAMNTYAENIGFAIPADRVRQVLNDQLLSRSRRAWLGFEVDEERLEVTRVYPGSPAESAGLRIGDRVVEVDGKPLEDPEDYHYSLLSLQPDTETGFVVVCGSGRRQVNITGWDRANGILYERLGLTVTPVTVGRQRIVRIESLSPDGPAARIRLQPGDLIESLRPLGGRARLLADPEQFAGLVVGLAPRTRLEIDVWRDDDGDGRYFEKIGEYSEHYKGTLTVE